MKTLEVLLWCGGVVLIGGIAIAIAKGFVNTETLGIFDGIKKHFTL